MPRSLSDTLLRQVPTLRPGQDLASAARTLLEARVGALPVVAEDGKLAGIFGEREFIAAAFPGYLRELHSAAFVGQAAGEGIELRDCGGEPVGRHMNTEPIEVKGDWSDAQVAEIFLHHRVLIVPVTDAGRLRGVITRSDFFAAVVGRVLDDGSGS